MWLRSFIYKKFAALVGDIDDFASLFLLYYFFITLVDINDLKMKH